MTPLSPKKREWHPLASRYVLYFILAALPAFLSVENQPSDGWEWAKFVAMIAYQGLLAVKAVQSQPDVKEAVAKPERVTQ